MLQSIGWTMFLGLALVVICSAVKETDERNFTLDCQFSGGTALRTDKMEQICIKGGRAIDMHIKR